MKLDKLPKLHGEDKKKRLGRGTGSGKGDHTVGRGHKGQKARGKVRIGFEGGQTPLHRRLPKFGGFKNPREKDIIAISLESLNKFRKGSTVTEEKLKEEGIISRIPRRGVKILANGELEKELKLKGLLVSKSAKKKIEEAGAELIE